MKIIRTASLTLIALAASTTVAFAQSSTPNLEIITPSDGGSVFGNSVPVLFNVENFEIVDFNQNQTPVLGKGHIHIWLDDKNPTPQSAVKVAEDNYTFSDVPFGSHTLDAELVTNNHQSLTPPQKVTVNFTNEPVSTPEAAVSSGFDKNTALVIFVVVALVIVAAWWYTKDEDEEEEFKEEKPKKKTTKRKSTKKKKKKK